MNASTITAILVLTILTTQALQDSQVSQPMLSPTQSIQKNHRTNLGKNCRSLVLCWYYGTTSCVIAVFPVPFFSGISVIGFLAQNAPFPQCLREHPWKASPTRRSGCSIGSESIRGIVVKPKAGVALRGFRDPRFPPIWVGFQPTTGNLLPGH